METKPSLKSIKIKIVDDNNKENVNPYLYGIQDEKAGNQKSVK